MKRVLCFAAVVATAATALIAAGGASAEAGVFNSTFQGPFSGSFYNICDLSQGVDSPMWIGSGFYTENVHLVQVSDTHYHLVLQTVTQLTGTYPDRRHVVYHSVMNSTGEVNIDPSSLDTGNPVLDSALVITSVEHDGIHVQGNTTIPDENYDAISHATYTPDLKLASLVVDFRGGCK